jgi:signal transduction histidine kinase
MEQRAMLSDLHTTEVFKESSIQVERTLDEAYYPALGPEELSARNNDQVITWTYRRTYSTDDTRTPILMVPQLWLWAVGEVVISAYSMTRESNLFVPFEDGMDKGTGDLSVGLRLALTIVSQIDNFGEKYIQKNSNVSVKLPSTLDIFETSVLSVLSEVNKYLDPTRPTGVDLQKEKVFIHDIWDILSELAMIQEILEQQEKVFDQLLIDNNWLEPTTKQLINPTQKGWDRIVSAKTRLSQYHQRINKIRRDSERIDKAIQDMLNLKRTDASIKEAHYSTRVAESSLSAANNSNKMAQNGIVLNAAVVGFTVVTIIFTPLSFLVGLFALPTNGVRRLLETNNETKDVYRSAPFAGVFSKLPMCFTE